MSLSKADIQKMQFAMSTLPESAYAEWADHAESVLTMASLARINGITLDNPESLEQLAAAVLTYVDSHTEQKGWWATEKRSLESAATVPTM